MNITNIRTFIPCKDFRASKQFYLDLGFGIVWEGNDIICFGNDQNNFFIQDYYNKEAADNFMMQLHVLDLDALHDIASTLVESYTSVRIKPIFLADYGRTFHLIDPSGVLWHMTEDNK